MISAKLATNNDKQIKKYNLIWLFVLKLTLQLKNKTQQKLVKVAESGRFILGGDKNK